MSVPAWSDLEVLFHEALARPSLVWQRWLRRSLISRRHFRRTRTTHCYCELNSASNGGSSRCQ